MKLFSTNKKTPSKKPADPNTDDRSPKEDTEAPPPLSRSPTKSSSSHSHRKSSRPSSFVESNNASNPATSTRRSRLSRHSTDPGHSRRHKIDPDTHPLNLPPEERNKRLSDLAMNGGPMDVDREPVNGAARASTPPNNPSAQANFSVPIPNGTAHDEAPVPPPHKSNPSSPTPTPRDDAESYKAAGNRFFKEKNYVKAIEQYSKGMVHSYFSCGLAC